MICLFLCSPVTSIMSKITCTLKSMASREFGIFYIICYSATFGSAIA